ncbi:MAG: S8/S53 family peptidase [Planctomycetota bacterium]|nr:S8/S53 family peptidase [Planctomycetota bacterium]
MDGDFMISGPALDAQLRVRAAHAVTRGAGVVVAVVDGGFNLRHPAIADALHPYGYDAIDGDMDAHDMGNGWDDDFDGVTDGGVGHGTFVAGMVRRIAPEASILPIRVRDDEGWGTDDELERGLMVAWALGADVVNISGESTRGLPGRVAALVRKMRKAGLVGVSVSQVARSKDSLIVGAVDGEDRLAPFSNRPAEAQRYFVLAPGVDLHGPVGIGHDESNGYWSGTSFATALVSGAAALVRAAEPRFDALDIMDRITESVDPAWDAHGRMLPYGRINLQQVVTR